MLCAPCQSICLRFDVPHEKAEIRTYKNFADLRLEEDGDIFYCRKKWTEPVYEEALSQSPIRVFYAFSKGAHNILVRYRIEAEKVSGFFQGPRCLKGEHHVGEVYVDSDSSLASVVHSRPFEIAPSKMHMIELACSWYETCRASHPACAKPIESKFLPTRLIDVIQGDKKRIYLRHVAKDFTVQYLALSYCWGKEPFKVLQDKNKDSMSEQGISLDELPATVRQACELCRKIGVRYLWIDALCIKQDDIEDWRRESANMEKVYSNAEFTIRAASADSAFNGIFGPRKWATDLFPQLKGLWTDGKEHLCSVRAILETPREPLDRRGWALQESLMSSRTLTFGTAEMGWECQQTYDNESKNHQTRVPGISSIFRRPIWRSGWIKQLVPGDLSDDDALHEDRLLLNAWEWLVREYSRRNLTFQKDKLPAISGLARWFAERFSVLQSDTYIAGLWKSQLPLGLLWVHYLPSMTNASKPLQYRGPSWSWVSLDCNWLDWCEKPGDSVAKIHGATVTPRGDDKFGEVVDGMIDIEAPLKEGWLVPTRSHPEMYDFWGDDWRERLSQSNEKDLEPRLGRLYIDLYDKDATYTLDANREERAQPSLCLLISEKCGILVETLESSGEKDTTDKYRKYRRTGVVIFELPRAASWWSGVPYSRLQLV